MTGRNKSSAGKDQTFRTVPSSLRSTTGSDGMMHWGSTGSSAEEDSDPADLALPELRGQSIKDRR